MGKSNLPTVLIHFQNHNKSRIGCLLHIQDATGKKLGPEIHPDRSGNVMVSPKKFLKIYRHDFWPAFPVCIFMFDRSHNSTSQHIDHLTQKCHSYFITARGRKYRQIKEQRPACLCLTVCLILSHLTAIYVNKGWKVH